MAERNKGGRPRLAEPLDQMVPVRFSKRELAALDEKLSGMGLARSTGVRALALMALDGRTHVRGSRPAREVRLEDGEPRVVVSAVPQTVFMPLPPGMEPEMAE